MPVNKTAGDKQSKISNFFQKPATKTKRNSNDENENPAKLAKLENGNSSTLKSPDSKNTDSRLEMTSPKRDEKSPMVESPLSPEQRERMEKSKQAAMEKLKEKQEQAQGIGASWKEALAGEFQKPYYKKLEEFVAQERKNKTIYPPENDVFSWTRYFDIKDTKVVMIGQDPYHGPGQAHGLCFSVQVGIALPPSLRNMYKELASDIEGFEAPKHGYLAGWATQGVLLLNACLTVVGGQANAHQGKGWEKLTDATIQWINKNVENVVFILWGAYAQKKGSFINKSRHLVLNGPHPSPLSAHRGFFGCKHFSKANTYLEEHNKKPIDWKHLPTKIQ